MAWQEIPTLAMSFARVLTVSRRPVRIANMRPPRAFDCLHPAIAATVAVDVRIWLAPGGRLRLRLEQYREEQI
jgi:hypothetical protein